MADTAGKKRIVVLGAGLGGLRVAQRLAKRSDCTVTLVTERDYFIFLPRLTEYFAASIPVERVVLPLKDAWKGELIIDKANLINPQEKAIVLDSGKTVPYDIVVISVGSQVNYFNTPGSQYSYAFYYKEDAEKLKTHIENLLEGDEQPGTHTFAIVGAGPTGVEVASVISRMVKKKRPASKVLLLEASTSILRVLPQKLGEASRDVLEELGVQIMTDTAVKNITPLSIEVEHKDGSKETIPCYTTIWAAGSKPQHIAITGVDLTPKGEVPVQPTLQCTGDPNIFALGDVAGSGLPKTAQVALQQAEAVADNIERSLAGKPLVPFKYNEKGTIIALDNKTVGLFFGKLVKGFLAQQVRDKYYRMSIAKYT